MTEEELNTRLYQKMYAEQEQYRQQLMELPPAKILEQAYEYVIREDFLLNMEENDLTKAQCKALLKSPTPLADLFERWEHSRSGHMDEILALTETHADERIREDAIRSLRGAR